MRTIRLAHRPELMRRLETELGAGSLLYLRLRLALERNDALSADAAYSTLRAESQDVQERVQAVMLDWLFGGDPAAGLADLPTGSPLVH